MNREATLQLFAKAIDGDFDAFTALRELDLTTQTMESFAPATFSLFPQTVLEVLQRLQKGELTTKEVQPWAEFIRWERFRCSNGALVRFPYELFYLISYREEGEIVDCLARLDELGDAVDGTIDARELNEWVAKFEQLVAE